MWAAIIGRVASVVLVLLTGLVWLALVLSRTEGGPSLTLIARREESPTVSTFDGHAIRRLFEPETLASGKISPSARPAWSPDGRWLVFEGVNQQMAFNMQSGNQERQRYELWLYDAQDGEVSRLVSDLEFVQRVGWSADGKRLLYGDGSAVWIAEMETGGAFQQLDLSQYGLGNEDAMIPVWSPVDPGRLALFLRSDGRLGDIAILDLDAQKAEPRLLLGAGGFIEALNWTPDGTAITYRLWGGTTGAMVDYIYDLATSRDQPLVPGHMGSVAFGWSPNGDLLAFSPDRRSVYLKSVETGQINRVASLENGSNLYELAWSPDGNRIALVAESPGSGCELVLVDVAREIQYQVDDMSLSCLAGITWQPEA